MGPNPTLASRISSTTFIAMMVHGSRSRRGGNRFQGIAVFIRSSVEHCEILPGRLMHVRMTVSNTIVDLLADQHAWHPDSSSGVLGKRMLLWTKLPTYTQNLPACNQLVVIGDFNCSLCSARAFSDGGATRPGLLRSQTLPTDSQHFVDYVQLNGLCALNTWLPSQEALHGYIPQRSSINSN